MANNPQNIQIDPATLLQGGMPAPTGTDENGQPYWIINNQKIVWAQMQQILWQQRQQLATATGGKGFESAPNLVNIPNMPTGMESQPEKGPNLNVEKAADTRLERRVESAGDRGQSGPVATKTQATKPVKHKVQKVIGDSPKLKSVNVEDVEDLHRYYKQNEDNADNPGKSDSYLTTLVGKILRQLAAASK